MFDVLSERAVQMHKDYLNDLILRRSIFESSYPNGVTHSYMRGKTLIDSEREKMRELSNRINAHKLFFDSFGENKYEESELVKQQYGDVSHLLNEVFKACMSSEGGYIYIVKQRGQIEVLKCGENIEPRLKPVLAVDNCEHVYFLDYGFDKERFLYRLLPYLSLSKIDQF